MTTEEIALKIRVLEAAKETVLFEIKEMRFYISSPQLREKRRYSKLLSKQIKYWKEKLKSYEQKPSISKTTVERRNRPIGIA